MPYDSLPINVQVGMGSDTTIKTGYHRPRIVHKQAQLELLTVTSDDIDVSATT